MSALWLNGSNWIPGVVPGNADVAQFGLNPTSGTNGVGINFGLATNNGTGNQAVGAIQVTGDRTANLIVGNSSTTADGVLTLNGAAVNSATTILANNSFSPISFTLQNKQGSGNQTMTVLLNVSGGAIDVTNSGASIVISSVLGDGGHNYGFTKTGDGILTLSGNNTFTGGAIVNAGILRMGSTTALNSTTPNAITFSAGSTGKLQLFGNGVTAAGLDSDAVTLGSPIIENASSTAAILTVKKVSGTSIFGGVIQNGTGGGAFSLAKDGAGTLVLSGNNSYTGTTTITSGRLKLASATALGAVSGGTSIVKYATLDLNGQSIGAEPITSLQGIGVGGIGALINSDTNHEATFAGTVNIGLVSSIGGEGDLTLSNAITGAYTLSKVGAGRLTLAANNATTLTSQIEVVAGTLRINNAGALGGTSLGTSVSAGATLDLWGQTVGAEPVIGIAGAGIDGNGALINSNTSAGASLSGTIAMSAAASFGGAGNLTLSNTITGGYALSKVGNGVLTLAGNNNYSGATTISAGKLLLNGTHSGGGIYTVKSGAMLSGNGTAAGAVTVESGGTVAPGAGVGQLSAAGFTLQSGANLEIEFTAPAGGSVANDQLVSSGATVNVGGAQLKILALGDVSYFSTPGQGWLVPGLRYTIVDNRGTNPVVGKFMIGLIELAEGTHIDALGTRFSISYKGWDGAGNDVVLTTAPEPSSLIMLSLPAIFALLRRRRI